MASRLLKPTATPGGAADLALSNKVFVSASDAQALRSMGATQNYVKTQIQEFVYTFAEHPEVKPGQCGFNRIQREQLEFGIGANEPAFEAFAFAEKAESNILTKLSVEGAKSESDIKTDDLTKVVLREYQTQFFTIGQRLAIDIAGKKLILKIKSCEIMDAASLKTGNTQAKTSSRGVIFEKTAIAYERAAGSTIRLVGDDNQANNTLFKPDFNFENMGIGGLDSEFGDIFRRAFASRIFPPSVVAKLGISHVKGILLYGPPGTGKTLMARQIGKMLNGKEPKVVNGPEVLDRFVGGSEENIRKLFKDAEEEYRTRKENSDLHIIIFDEIDAICKQRGSRNDGTGVGDTVVNQLLTKIDGVDSLNNILIIGMTNRKDLIDEALLRPGRLEVHMEISLPDEKGRHQIWVIQTKSMRENGSMDQDVSLELLAKDTKNYSGAEIKGVVNSATSFALNSKVDATNGIKVKDGPITVKMEHFQRALAEVKPAFGIDEDEFSDRMRNGIIKFGPKVEKLLNNCGLFVEQVRNSQRTPLVSFLLEGPAGCGKTALAVKLATDSGCPFVKMISAEDLVGYGENAKASKITKIFEDAHRSRLSCVVVDDIERLIDYARVGPRFSNVILQTLLVFLKKDPPKNRKLLIIGTTSNKRVLEDLEILDTFNSVQNVPQISTRTEFSSVLKELKAIESDAELNLASAAFARPISIKRLIMYAEMASQGSTTGRAERLSQILVDNE
ncbi:hypothetical protein PROFUN_07962 [Planoprotostelium fungivorum]|uniref:Vesicle-fusing ATPase n=1 Tax=Planoprotostelium fungivorum TaxID=1890364 RepID=A0A2P6NLB1_9EUKA|nr:hypothetical protein PROFUN_07962 [Planoprotostelium fungivorum]